MQNSLRTNKPDQPSEQLQRTRRLFLITGCFLVLALLLGGAGLDYPLLRPTVLLGAVFLLWFVSVTQPSVFEVPGIKLPLSIVALVLAVPVLQLTPIPFDLWAQLPGRGPSAEILRMTGLAGWRPMSMDAAATLDTALELLPFMAIFFAVLYLDGEKRLKLAFVIIGMAVLSTVVGLFQKTSGLTLFDSPQLNSAPGLFVHRNHQATLLLIAMPLTAACAIMSSTSRVFSKSVALTLIAVFAVGIVATTSRMGFALLIPALASALALLFPGKWSYRRIGTTVAGLLILGWIVLSSAGGQLVVERFADFLDERNEYWSDTARAIRAYFPLGSGLGTFPSIYSTVEDINHVGLAYPYNAHNDYVELALEVGLLALVILVLFLFFVFRSSRQTDSANRNEHRSLTLASIAAITVVLLFSIVEYPLRAPALMATFGYLCGILLAPHRSRHGSRREERTPLGESRSKKHDRSGVRHWSA